jgi:hypothetical protein
MSALVNNRQDAAPDALAQRRFRNTALRGGLSEGHRAGRWGRRAARRIVGKRTSQERTSSAPSRLAVRPADRAGRGIGLEVALGAVIGLLRVARRAGLVCDCHLKCNRVVPRHTRAGASPRTRRRSSAPPHPVRGSRGVAPQCWRYLGCEVPVGGALVRPIPRPRDMPRGCGQRPIPLPGDQAQHGLEVHVLPVVARV